MPNKVIQADGSVLPIVALAGSAASGASLAPLGYQQIVGPAASTALTVPNGAKTAFLQAEGQPIRYRDDGVAPTATVGMLIPVGAPVPYEGSLAALRFIQTAATGTLNVTYYG